LTTCLNQAATLVANALQLRYIRNRRAFFFPLPQPPWENQSDTILELHHQMSEKQLEQAGAIPFRQGTGGWEFLIITSRKGNWIFPKGVIGADESPREAALKECAEEAGISGTIVGEAVGSYPDRRRKRPCSVEMFLLRYEGEVIWKEQDSRQRHWCGFDEASELLRKEPVRELLARALELLELDRAES